MKLTRKEQREQQIEQWKTDLSSITCEDDRAAYFIEHINPQLDRDEYNNNHKHDRRRDDRSSDEIESWRSKLNYKMNFEDIIFKNDYDDLHKIVTESVLSGFIKDLPDKQKEVLFYTALRRLSTSITAKIKKTSSRNVFELQTKALTRLRGQIQPVIKFKRKLETHDEYTSIRVQTGVHTVNRERIFLRDLGNQYAEYYGEMRPESIADHRVKKNNS